MENASKALLIAGAILLVLAIISLSVIIFGKGKIFVTTMDKQLSQSDIQNHNSQFIRYEGNVSGSLVKDACTLVVKTNNKNNKISMSIIVFDENDNQIAKHPNSSNNANDYNKIMNDISNTQVFEGTLTYNNQGIIDKITFEAK